MTRRVWILVLLLTTALAVTTLGWIRATDRVHFAEDKPARFESCRFDGTQLVLGYAYGANQLVAPAVDTRAANKIVVELETRVGDGVRPAIGLSGQASFLIFGADLNTVIEYTDGHELDCKRPKN